VTEYCYIYPASLPVMVHPGIFAGFKKFNFSPPFCSASIH
jgi:hypothetical protein